MFADSGLLLQVTEPLLFLGPYSTDPILIFVTGCIEQDERSKSSMPVCGGDALLRRKRFLKCTFP